MTTDSSSVDSGDAGGAGCKAPPEIGGSEKGQNLTFAYWSLAITASTSAFEKLQGHPQNLGVQKRGKA